PVRALLGDTRRVFLSPDGPLNLVPFAALLDPHGRPLLERYTFTYLTSGRDLRRRAAQAPAPPPPPPPPPPASPLRPPHPAGRPRAGGGSEGDRAGPLPGPRPDPAPAPRRHQGSPPGGARPVAPPPGLARLLRPRHLLCPTRRIPARPPPAIGHRPRRRQRLQ